MTSVMIGSLPTYQLWLTSSLAKLLNPKVAMQTWADYADNEREQNKTVKKKKKVKYDRWLVGKDCKIRGFGDIN